MVGGLCSAELTCSFVIGLYVPPRAVSGFAGHMCLRLFVLSRVRADHKPPLPAAFSHPKTDQRLFSSDISHYSKEHLMDLRRGFVLLLLLAFPVTVARTQEVTAYRVLNITFNTTSPVELALNRGRLIWRDTDPGSGNFLLKYYSGAETLTLDSNLTAVSAAIEGDHIVWNTPIELVKVFDTRSWETEPLGASYNPDFAQPVSAGGDFAAYAARKPGSGTSIVLHRFSSATDTTFSDAAWNTAPSVHHGQLAWVGADSESASASSNIFFFNGRVTRNLSGTTGFRNRGPILRDGQVAWLESTTTSSRVRLYAGDSVVTLAAPPLASTLVTGYDLSDGVAVAALKDTLTGKGTLRIFDAETGLTAVVADSNGPSHPRLSNGLLTWQSGVGVNRRVEIYILGGGISREYSGGEKPVVDADLVAWTNGDAVELSTPVTMQGFTSDATNGWEQTKFKTIDSSHIVWGNFANSVNMRLFYGDGGTAIELADSATSNDLVMANDGYVIWRRNFDSLFYFDGSHPPVKFLDTVQAENPYVARGSIGFFGSRLTVNETIKHAWLYEIGSGKLTMLSSDSGVTGNVLCDGNTACWLNGHTQRLMFYNGSITTQLSDSLTEYNYSYRNGRIAWTEYRNGYSQVFLYDTNTKSKTQLTTAASFKEYPITDGAHVVWYETFPVAPASLAHRGTGPAVSVWGSGSIMTYYDVSSGEVRRVANTSFSNLFWNWMNNGKIAWLQNDGTIAAYDGNVVSQMMPNDGFRAYSNVYLDRDMLLWRRSLMPPAKDNGDIFRQKLRPHVGFTAVNLAGDVPLTVPFRNRSWEGAQTYSWNFGDGGTSTERDPVHTYLTPGDYTVTMTVTGLTGSVSEKKFHLVRATSTADIAGDPTTLPERTELLQNYPNPFNPSTRIGYRVQGTGYVTLKLYDVLGREIETLVKEVKQPGSYTVTWDASRVATGVYFDRLTAGNLVQTRKMILVR
jgi:PKD repeat protein